MLVQALSVVASASVVMAATQHVVLVGPDHTLNYEPSTVQASVGDTILFQFQAGNHSVTQSTFQNPCTYSGGFNSGFFPISGNPVDVAITVETSDPIWMFCAQDGHCEAGMVFAVNPPSSGDTFSAFVSNAESGNTASATTTMTGSAAASLISTWTASTTLTVASGSASATASASDSSSSMTSGGYGMASSSSAATSSGASSTSSASAAAKTSGGASALLTPSAAGLFLSFLLSAFM
ncbi:hypothetical protein BD324DRAFT_653221 [Kockovaella imperatae]|uniref:Phytocyanin domain-containing protein n=1 Tax=Kockovaella imperatae TaxID=4999 RepID=A0A1Y1UA71_9TREE|nr:hypothetical protein BD324DRAFT_653221 [Kockovaella imperatae]ORX34444.1 hypothetical protein BD324DRAFT_653221 [Kockovaella imperatae]